MKGTCWSTWMCLFRSYNGICTVFHGRACVWRASHIRVACVNSASLETSIHNTCNRILQRRLMHKLRSYFKNKHYCRWLGLWELRCAPPCGDQTILSTTDLRYEPLHCASWWGLPPYFYVWQRTCKEGSQCSPIPTYTLVVHNFSGLRMTCEKANE